MSTIEAILAGGGVALAKLNGREAAFARPHALFSVKVGTRNIR